MRIYTCVYGLGTLKFTKRLWILEECGCLDGSFTYCVLSIVLAVSQYSISFLH